MNQGDDEDLPDTRGSPGGFSLSLDAPPLLSFYSAFKELVYEPLFISAFMHIHRQCHCQHCGKYVWFVIIYIYIQRFNFLNGMPYVIYICYIYICYIYVIYIYIYI